MTSVQEYVGQLQDLAELINKAQTNYKKCPKVHKTKGYLQARVQCIDDYWNSFRQKHMDLVKVTSKDDRTSLSHFVNDVHSRCEEVYTCLKADMMDYLQQIQSSTSRSLSPSYKPSTSSSPEVKLPRINLPIFSGAYEEWQSFENTFMSLIHNNKTLNNVQKLHYLKSCVIGEAKNTIKHFQITEKNYAPAWDNLKNRYSQRRLIVNAILRRLFTLKKLSSPSPVHLKSLIDNTKECLNSLNSLNISTESWDPINIFLVIQKLDSESHRSWEAYVSSDYLEELPTFANLTTFLDSRICTLELTSTALVSRDKMNQRTYLATTSAQYNCILCSENHQLCHCKQFGKMDPDKRSEYVTEKRLCYNCLAPGHSMIYCRQRTSCVRVCGRRHHSLLHSFTKKENKDKNQQPQAMASLHANMDESNEDQDEDVTNIATHYASHFTNNRKSSLLATAVVPVRSSSGHMMLLRALIDLGSEASFVSERAAQKLKVNKTPTHAKVVGLGSTETKVSHSTQLEVLSRYEVNFSLNVEVYIVSTQLTLQLPSKSISPTSWSHLDGLTLADPRFNIQGRVDMLLGVQVYTDIVKANIIKGPSGTPCAQETSLGWIVFGKARDESNDDRIIAYHQLEILDVLNMLKNMQHIEETSTRSMTADKMLCEEIYSVTLSRTTDGCYVVKLPLKSAHPIEEIGETRDIALKRFYQLESRLEGKPKKKDADLQRIWWRRDTKEKVKEYRKLRVTFETAPVPYLSVKTLIQLAKNEGKYFPNAARVIKEDINRWTKTYSEDLENTTIHGFSDASNKAYCAIVFARVETKDSDIKSSIIASKTRVAPVKSITLPRHELCGALLLAKLLTQVCDAMRISKEKVFAWTDSSVVISWLFGDPHRWKLFVSNRVIEILDNVANTQWFHVASKDNPADIGSRGRELPQLIESKLWWEGPDWLQTKDLKLREPNVPPTDIERTLQVNLKIDHESEQTIKFENFENLQEAQKVIAYSIRFINSKKQPEKLEESMSTEEHEEALMKCIKIAQTREFRIEIERLTQKKNIRKDSKVLNLNPYLDENNILRVGGRLRNSDLETEQKHPIILGRNTYLTDLIIKDAHNKTLHGGIQLMLCYLRSKYWITHAKNAVKACIHKCLICARQRATTRTQKMGDLPKFRVTEARAFVHSGVDFAGPLQVLMSKNRGAKSNKAYIAIFICMATKAIHLELVGDLSSESFIGAFHRFVARRGKCTHIWSDQGRNFIGANRELAEAFKEACFELPGEVANILASDGTQWHYIPAYSPNFGGLWESGVKSTKFHLKRILTKTLTFEEMTTTLCQIEACLNSRPLTPIDASDPDVIEPLTPGHFFIGEPPVVIPSPDLRHVNVNRLSRWQYTQKLVRDFWHRWQSEYITRLQERPKWMKSEKELEIGDIVIVKDDCLPPGKWSLGRILDKHVGKDGHTRVYSLKCRGDIIKRSISKLVQMPIEKGTT